MVRALFFRWEAFWFSPASSEILAWVRMAVAATVMCKMVGLHGLYRITSWRVIWPWARASRAEDWVESGSYVPQLGALRWVPHLDVATADRLIAVMLGLGALMFVGAATRVVTGLLIVVLGWTMFHTSMDYRHHENVMFWTLTALFFAPCADYHSVDTLFTKNRPPTRPIVHIRMLQVLLTTIYVSTTFGKLDWGWWSGAAMQAMHDEGHFRGPFWGVIWQFTGPVFLSRYTVAAEAFCAFGFWIPRLRIVAAVVGAGLHLGIDLMMPVTTFSFQMLTLYAVFLSPAPGKIRAALAPASLWLSTKRAFDRLFRRAA